MKTKKAIKTITSLGVIVLFSLLIMVFLKKENNINAEEKTNQGNQEIYNDEFSDTNKILKEIEEASKENAEINKAETQISDKNEKELMNTITTNKALSSMKEAYVIYDQETSIKETEDNKKIDNNNEQETPEVYREREEAESLSVSKAYLTLETGTPSYDTFNYDGGDMNGTNDVVRSYDKISYMLSFSIQNISTIDYTNFEYRVTTKLPNAYVNDPVKPKLNGQIVNGKFIENETGQESQSIFESTIATNGQVFIPITVSVLGAENKTEIVPEFEIEIISAYNTVTKEEEEFNLKYTKENIPALEVPVTYVSAAPSVKVQLVQGIVGTNTMIDSTNPNISGYDIGAVVHLAPLPEPFKRGSVDYRGSSFPKEEIKYQIKTKGTYIDKKGIENSTKGTLTEDQYNNFQLIDYSVANLDRTKSNWSNGATKLDLNQFDTLPSLQGKTDNVYITEPTTKETAEMGVYNSGKFTMTSELNVTNTDYIGVSSPYMYLMNKDRALAPLDKGITSLEAVLSWDKEKTIEIGKQNGWVRYDMSLYIDEITYDGITRSNQTEITYPNLLDESYTDWYRNVPTIGVPAYPGTFSIIGGTFRNGTPGTTGSFEENYGDVKLITGQKIIFTNYSSSNVQSMSNKIKKSETIQTWDPTAFKYDNDRLPSQTTESLKNRSGSTVYGVAKDITKTPPYTMQVGTVEELLTMYTWYDSITNAQKKGDISALYLKMSFDSDPTSIVDPLYGPMLKITTTAPLVVIGETGSKSPAGNPLVNIASQRFTDADGNIIAQSTTTGTNEITGAGIYKPTIFSSNGIAQSFPMHYTNALGDSAYINKFGISTTTKIGKTEYNAEDEIDITSTGILSGATTAKYGASLNVKLPAGVIYKKGTAIDKDGKVLPDPDITINSDNSTTLTFKFDNIEDSTKNLVVNFKSKTDINLIDFINGTYSPGLNVTTLGEMWSATDESVKDDRPESFRTSQGSFRIKLIQQIYIAKSVDKNAIEVGENSETKKPNTSITYNVNMTNYKLAPVKNAKFIDVLPYNGDSRGTIFSGELEIEELTIDNDSSKIKIYYSQTEQKDDIDPNKVDMSSFKQYKPGETNIENLKGTKAIILTHGEMKIGESVNMTIKVKPRGQTIDDVLYNNANMNSELDLHVKSQKTITEVYGREISGLAWYDENKDGLYNNNESKYIGMPVELYQIIKEENGTEKSIQITNDLKGNKFTNELGESTVITNTEGEYKFDNLNEGTYYIKFVVEKALEQKQYQITEQNVNSPQDDSINSKANRTTGITGNYILPNLETIVEGNYKNNTYSVPNINIGILAEKGKVILYKYIQGTEKDENNDGKISDDEKAKANPLKGAEFDVYRKSTNSKVATGITDDNGLLEFEFEYGDYYLIESKAPEGYELNKTKIPFTISYQNREIKLYVANEKTTNLPFTGFGRTQKIILLLALTLIIAALLISITQLFKNKEKKRVLPRKK